MDNRLELLNKIMEGYDKNSPEWNREMFEELVASAIGELSDERVGILHFKYFSKEINDRPDNPD